MNQRGLAESTQWAVLSPIFLALVLGLVQVGVWLHARTVAANAAATVADIRVHGADQESAARLAGLRIAAGGGLGEADVAIGAGGGVLTVTVSGRAPLFFDLSRVPVFSAPQWGRIAATAVLPTEEVSKP